MALNMAMKHLGLFERDNTQQHDNLKLEVVIAGGPTAWSDDTQQEDHCASPARSVYSTIAAERFVLDQLEHKGLKLGVAHGDPKLSEEVYCACCECSSGKCATFHLVSSRLTHRLAPSHS